MDNKYKKQIELYSDNQMDKSDSRRLEETIKFYPALEDYLQKLERQKKLLKLWWKTQRKN